MQFARAGFSEVEAQGMFVQLDTDNSGAINFDEFRVWYIEELGKTQAPEEELE
jgi:Ca2+-binding EF-hand superfamily protein